MSGCCRRVSAQESYRIPHTLEHVRIARHREEKRVVEVQVRIITQVPVTMGKSSRPYGNILASLSEKRIM